jgi:hypothetical protein
MSTDYRRVTYRKHHNTIFVRYRKEKCIKPVLHGYGTNIQSLMQAVYETYAELRKELEEQGCVVA